MSVTKSLPIYDPIHNRQEKTQLIEEVDSKLGGLSLCLTDQEPLSELVDGEEQMDERDVHREIQICS